MTDIASNLDKVIEKLDGMTSEVVAKNYGMDIASKVDHIAKQLDYVQAGGGSGGETPVYVHLKQENNTWQLDGITFDELMALCKAEKCLGALVVNEVDDNVTANVYHLHSYADIYEVAVYFINTFVAGGKLQNIELVVRQNGINYYDKQYTLTEAT